MKRLYDRSDSLGEFVPAPDDELIICRCEEITKGEIRRAVHEGMCTITEVRRFLRAGMGLCQGQTCARLVQAIVAAELGSRLTDLEPAPCRAPMRPLEMYVLGDEKEGGGLHD